MNAKPVKCWGNLRTPGPKSSRPKYFVQQQSGYWPCMLSEQRMPFSWPQLYIGAKDKLRTWSLSLLTAACGTLDTRKGSSSFLPTSVDQEAAAGQEKSRQDIKYAKTLVFP